MAKEIIGIDISDYSIEAVLLQKKGKSFEVVSYSRFRLSPDIVEDGNVLNKGKLQEAIQQTLFHAQPHQIQADKVFLSIPESKVFTKVISLPDDLLEKDIREAAQNKAAEVIPEASENLVPAMKVLPVANGFRDVFYSAAQLGAIKDMVDVFKNLNIEVLGITSESISSFVGLDDTLKDKTTLLLDIGNRTTIASVFDKNGIRDTININVAGENIIKSLVAKMGVSYDVAEEKMRDVGMVYSVEHGETMMIVQGQLQPLLDEVKIFVNYFERSTDKKIEQLVLIGGLAQMKGIDKYFGENLSLPAVRGISFLGDNILPNQASSTKYINALGLARFSFENLEINFYNDEFKKKITDKKEGKGNDKETGPEKFQKVKPVKKDDTTGVKILEEEEEDDFDETPKPFYKNKVVATILIILCLASVFVIFKDKIFALIQKDDVSAVELKTPGQENVAENVALESPKVLTANVFVGLTNYDDIKPFVEAEIFESTSIRNFPSEDYDFEQFNIISELGPGSLVGLENPNVDQPTEEEAPKILFTENDDAIVSKILNDIFEESKNEILATVLQKEGYYIIPSVINSEMVAIKDNEEDVDARFSTRFIIRHSFYMIEENKIEELLLASLSPEEKSDLDNYTIKDKKYSITGRRDGDIFQLNLEHSYSKNK